MVEILSEVSLLEEAQLLLDSASGAAALGVRASCADERCLLFEASGLHLELRLAPRSAESASTWLYGLVLRSDGGPAAQPAHVTLRQGGYGAIRVEVGDNGEFAVPCNPTMSLSLDVHVEGRTAVRVTVPV